MKLNGFPSAEKRNHRFLSSVLCPLTSILSSVCRHILPPARRSRCKPRPLSAPRIARRANIRRSDTYCTSLLFLLFNVYGLANPVICRNHRVRLWQLLARYNHRRIIQLEFHNVVFVARVQLLRLYNIAYSAYGHTVKLADNNLRQVGIAEVYLCGQNIAEYDNLPALGRRLKRHIPR